MPLHAKGMPYSVCVPFTRCVGLFTEKMARLRIQRTPEADWNLLRFTKAHTHIQTQIQGSERVQRDLVG